MNEDITGSVEFGAVDGEVLHFIKCACGKEFESWDFLLSIYEDSASICPNCKRKLFFRTDVRVYEVID